MWIHLNVNSLFFAASFRLSCDKWGVKWTSCDFCTVIDPRHRFNRKWYIKTKFQGKMKSKQQQKFSQWAFLHSKIIFSSPFRRPSIDFHHSIGTHILTVSTVSKWLDRWPTPSQLHHAENGNRHHHRSSSSV